MKKQILANFLVLLGTILFNLLFWKEKMGLNTLLFTLFLLGGLRLLHPKSFKKRVVRFTTLGALLAAGAVVWNATTLSKITYMLSTFTLIGFVQQRELRFLGYGFLLALTNFFKVPKNALKYIKWQAEIKPTLLNFFKGAGRLFIPLMVIILFFQLYYHANPKFAELFNAFTQISFQWMDWQISLSGTVFWIFSFFIAGTIFWTSESTALVERQQEARQTLVRERSEARIPIFKNSLALKTEYRNAVFLIFVLNALLCLVNWTDIQFVWFNFEGGTPQQLSQYVHGGTYTLIASILLAMGVLLFFFRKNLNFYPNNRVLKILAYIWIIQNAILTCSVAIRNFHYVYHYGLAYKRIGVFVFLILVWLGLMWLFFKIKEKRTFHYLLHRNIWTLYVVLLLSSLINWGVFITQYNLFARTDTTIDVNFLIHQVPDANLFLLEENVELLKQRGRWHHKGVEQALYNKRYFFEYNQEKLSWLSWNYADFRNSSNKNSDSHRDVFD